MSISSAVATVPVVLCLTDVRPSVCFRMSVCVCRYLIRKQLPNKSSTQKPECLVGRFVRVYVCHCCCYFLLKEAVGPSYGRPNRCLLRLKDGKESLPTAPNERPPPIALEQSPSRYVYGDDGAVSERSSPEEHNSYLRNLHLNTYHIFVCLSGLDGCFLPGR